MNSNGYPSTEVPPLFAQAAAPVSYAKPKPAAPVSRAAGRAAIDPERNNIAGFVAGALYAAGPVVNGRGGLTLPELAYAVSVKRNKPTKVTTVCQPLKNLRGENDAGEVVNRVYAMDSGQRRMGDSDTRVTIWIHAAHAPKCVPAVPSNSTNQGASNEV